MALVYYLGALAWWLGNGMVEIDAHMAYRDEPDALLAFAALTGWLAAEVHRRHPSTALAWTTLAALASAAPFALWQSEAHQQPFAGHGAWAWLAYAVLGVRSLMCLREGSGAIAGLAQLAWWLLWPTVLSLLAWHIGDRFSLAEGCQPAAGLVARARAGYGRWLAGRADRAAVAGRRGLGAIPVGLACRAAG